MRQDLIRFGYHFREERLELESQGIGLHTMWKVMGAPPSDVQHPRERLTRLLALK